MAEGTGCSLEVLGISRGMEGKVVGLEGVEDGGGGWRLLDKTADVAFEEVADVGRVRRHFDRGGTRGWQATGAARLSFS